MAEKEGLDVVEVSGASQADLPICKILDYGKLTYQESKKKKSQKQHKKEIKYNYNISNHDLAVKHNKIFKFLSKSYIVSYTLELKGRENHLVGDAVNKIKDNLKNFESVATWKEPSISKGGRGVRISTVLQPIK